VGNHSLTRLNAATDLPGVPWRETGEGGLPLAIRRTHLFGRAPPPLPQAVVQDVGGTEDGMEVLYSGTVLA
jgi:hypothetical protein